MYRQFVQKLKTVTFHNNDGQIIVDKITNAYINGKHGFLNSMKNNSKIQKPTHVNISQSKIEEILPFKMGENEEEFKFLLNREIFLKVESLFEKVCSENPIDPIKYKQWMKANIKLIDSTTIIIVKPMKYGPQDVEEFSKQIKELLEIKVIIPSKYSHRSPAFLVENEADIRRGKKRMVVNYIVINKETIGDNQNLPNKDGHLTLIRGKTIFSSFDCKSTFGKFYLTMNHNS